MYSILKVLGFMTFVFSNTRAKIYNDSEWRLRVSVTVSQKIKNE